MANNSSRVLIIIPARNEAPNIAGVLASAKVKCPSVDILVVNDASEDATGEIARKHGVNVLDMPFRLGIGGAMQTGFIYAAQNRYDIAVQLDGDGQHDPSEIKTLIGPLLSGEADVAIGSRFLGKGGYRPDFAHRLGCGILSKLLSFFTGNKITDPTSGFRVANRAVINFYAEDYPVDYPEPEAIILLSRKGFRIKEIPTVMARRQSGESSIIGLHAVYYMIKVMLAICIAAISRKNRKG